MKDNKKLINGLIIAACIIIVIAIIIIYAFFMSNNIFEESANHLEEIYIQVGDMFNQKVVDYQNAMSSWKHYIVNLTENENEETNNQLRSFINEQKEQWGFSYFYFVRIDDPDSATGATVKTIDGEISKLNLRRNASVLLDSDEGGVVVRDVNDAGQVLNRYMMFVESFQDVNQNDYDGFSYDMIGIAFESDALQKSLQVQAFNDMGACFIVLPDAVGNVLLRSSKDLKTEEFLVMLRNHCNFSRGQSASTVESYFNKVAAADKNQIHNFKSETLLMTVRETKTEYYLTYKTIGFSDWVLCGIVPSSILNNNMGQFRSVTIGVMCSIFAVVVGGIVWLLVILSNRRVREKELTVESRENLLDILSQNSRDIFVLFNADKYDCEYVSSNIHQVLGLNTDSVTKDVREISQAITGDLDLFNKEASEALEKNGTWATYISMENSENKEPYWYRMTLKRAEYKGNNNYVLMLSDRTKDRKMRGDLETALSLAKTANEAKSNFLANMSHDIRTPMNAIIGFATLIAKDAENPDKVREYIRKISFSSQHLLSLINDVLDMSKIESGKSSLNIEEFNLPELLEEQYAMILPQTKAKKQSFEVRTKGYIPEFVYGDKLRINQILLNLLSNAVKYTPESGDIVLLVESVNKAAHKHTHLRITVQDNGIGMSEEFAKVVFDPFSRETTAVTKEIQGTGLGMAITKQIVDLMGGTIRVQSEMGKGTAFILEIELAVASIEERNDKDFWKNNEIFRVLVVDDEEDVCNEVRELMEDTGVEVDYSLSGKEAVEKVKVKYNTDSAYNIVLLDWKMPEMDGVETARRIRSIVDKDIPIMILTSYNFDEIEEEARNAGIDLFLSKPFFVSNFRHAVSQLNDVGKDEEESEDTVSPFSLDGLHILAAEDNEINAEILQELLDIEGATCDIAENGQIALEKFEKSAPGTYDFIFMDVQMPVMNGYDATRSIRACSHEEAKSIPIIAMTANAFDDDVRSALDAGMNAHLAKPIDMLKLKALIAKLRGGNNE